MEQIRLFTKWKAPSFMVQYQAKAWPQIKICAISLNKDAETFISEKHHLDNDLGD